MVLEKQKNENVTPVFRKGKKGDRESYRLVSLKSR